MKYYIDGSCKGNPGIGGWAVIVIDGDSLHDSIGSFMEPIVTNNMMELYSLIHCMCYIITIYKDKHPIIYTDSMYNINCYKSCDKWLKKPNLKNNKYVKAVCYMKEALKKHGYKLKLEKVDGHSGDKWNDEADRLACTCAVFQKSQNLKYLPVKISNIISGMKTKDINE